MAYRDNESQLSAACDMNLHAFSDPMQSYAALSHFLLRIWLTILLLTASRQGQAEHPDPPRPGVSNARRASDRWRTCIAQATFAVEGEPDWMVVTEDAVWVTSSNVNHVVRLDPATNQRGHNRHHQEAVFGTGGGIRQHLGSELRSA